MRCWVARVWPPGVVRAVVCRVGSERSDAAEHSPNQGPAEGNVADVDGRRNLAHVPVNVAEVVRVAEIVISIQYGCKDVENPETQDAAKNNLPLEWNVTPNDDGYRDADEH